MSLRREIWITSNGRPIISKLVNKHGKYFLHIPVTYDVEDSNLSDVCNAVGIDRGIHFVVDTYDSKHKSGFVSGRYVSGSWSFYDLENTSQCCPICAHIEKSNRDKKLHLFTCKNCGYKSNDERIGATNLYRMGINYLERNVEKYE